MNEYRATFPNRYPRYSIGWLDPGARQGYYVLACNVKCAKLAAVSDATAEPGEVVEVEYFRTTGLKVSCDACGRVNP